MSIFKHNMAPTFLSGQSAKRKAQSAMPHALCPMLSLGIGMVLVALVLMPGCSLEWPTGSTSDEGLDQPRMTGTPALAQPQLLHRPHPVAKIAPEGGSILYGGQWIGKKGGALVVGNDFTGKVRVVVAPGALTRRTLITMKVPMYGNIVVDFGPDGTAFRKACTVELSYKDADLTGVNEDEIRAWYSNETTGEWEYMGGKVDGKRKVVKFYVNHFSRYGLAPRRR